jgi:hypothetical protein
MQSCIPYEWLRVQSPTAELRFYCSASPHSPPNCSFTATTKQEPWPRVDSNSNNRFSTSSEAPTPRRRPRRANRPSSIGERPMLIDIAKTTTTAIIKVRVFTPTTIPIPYLSHTHTQTNAQTHYTENKQRRWKRLLLSIFQRTRTMEAKMRTRTLRKRTASWLCRTRTIGLPPAIVITHLDHHHPLPLLFRKHRLR